MQGKGHTAAKQSLTCWANTQDIAVFTFIIDMQFKMLNEIGVKETDLALFNSDSSFSTPWENAAARAPPRRRPASRGFRCPCPIAQRHSGKCSYHGY
jgi:hypothetical protein